MASEENAVATTPSSAKFPHSHSSQGAMDAVSLNESSESKQRSGKLLSVNVIMLDDSNITLHVQHKALGQALFDLVCKQLSLLEVDYFGLEYEDSSSNQYWLDCEKPMNRQLDLSLVDCTMRFGVKFYTPDPAQLEEEYTRYMFCQQIKKDLSTGMLQCNDNTAAIMASYIVQADCGDYVPDDYPDHTYLSSNKFVPHQDSEMERRIMENHKKHVGQNPAEADLNLLETARRCELYGIRMHPAKDHEGVPLNLAIAHMGVLVFQNYTKINTFSWAKIRKLSFKRKRFLIKLHPEGYASPNVVESASSCQGYYKDTVEFFFEGRNECKNFWKKCVEHHGFFRCSMVKKLPRQKTRVLSRGSSFRYSGRTQKQVVDFVRDNYVKRQPFQRSQSFRHPNSANSSIGKVGASKSAQPLLPVGDQTVGTPASQSCGSMVLNDSGSTEALASPTRERAEIHSDDQASGEYKLSPMASPKLNSDQRQSQDERVQQPFMNGGVAETQTVAGRKEGEVGLPQTEVHPKASTRSCTESPSSRSSLRQDDSSKDQNEADGEDNLSQDSYQLFDAEGGTSPQKRVYNGVKISAMGAPHDRISNGDTPLSISQSVCPTPSQKPHSNSEHIENEQGKGVNGKGEHAVSGVDNDIAYVLHKRHFANAEPVREVSETPPPLPSQLTHPANLPSAKSSASGVGSGQKGFKPVKPPRIQVDVDHQKITQSSPTLYARSRLNREDSPLRHNSATSPKSPLPRSLDFVCVHDLPAVFSYSSKDDSIANHFIEKVVELQAQKRRSGISNASSSSLQSRDSDYLEPLRIVEDGDEDVAAPASDGKTAACHNSLSNNGATPICNGSGKMSSEQQQFVDRKEDELEWEALAPLFPPPPPPPFHEMDDDDYGYLDSIPDKGSIDVARNKFLRSTIVDVSNSDGKKVYLEELSDVSNDETYDNDTTVTVEESSDTGDATVVENYPPPPPRSLVITEQEDNEVEGGGEAKAESYTTFGADEYYSGEIEDITASVHDDDMANAETDSLPQDPELDDEEVEPCPPLEDTLLFPVRTLSRISERSTSEQSESKDSTPTQESKPSDDRHPSACDLPSDYSTSDDNPSDCGGASSNESEGSPSRGRAPGTGSGLGLSPVRAIRTTAVFDSHRLYENRYVLPDDGSQLETYYMEIDPVQQEQLEKGVFDRIEYDPIPGDNFEDTSSTDVTLHEEISPLDEFSPSSHCLETYTGGLTPRYEGFDVRINVVPSTSPSPIRTPEPHGPDSSPGSTCSSGSMAKRRHRSSIELQVSNGHILENKHASLASPSIDDSGPGTTFVNLYADALNKD